MQNKVQRCYNTLKSSGDQFFLNQVLTKIDKFLAELLEFNKAIVQFDAVLTGMDSWINGKGQVWQDFPIVKYHLPRRNWLHWGNLTRKMWRQIPRRGLQEEWSWWRILWRGFRPAPKQKRQGNSFSHQRERKCQRSKKGIRMCHDDVNVRTQRSFWTGWRPAEMVSTSLMRM